MNFSLPPPPPHDDGDKVTTRDAHCGHHNEHLKNIFRFSFGLGKRSSPPGLRPDVARLLSSIKVSSLAFAPALVLVTVPAPALSTSNKKGWGLYMRHGLYKRAQDLNEREERDSTEERTFNYGLGKRSSPPHLRPDVMRLLSSIKVSSPTSVPVAALVPSLAAISVLALAIPALAHGAAPAPALSTSPKKGWGYSGPHGLYKRAHDLDEEDEGDSTEDRAFDYDLNLGSSAGQNLNPEQENKRSVSYGFGLGKRANYGFDLGKRSAYSFGLGKRSLNDGIDQGKRAFYGFGRGKWQLSMKNQD